MDLNKKLEELKPQQLNCNVFDVYSYNGLSMQDLLCQFFTKINECINISNETIDLAKWLVNEGLEIEVVKKLMLWLEDGTLENIINENIFKSLNEKIDIIVNTPHNFMLYSFFERNESPVKTSFYISSDGVGMKKISGDYKLDARDPSIIYKDGYFYVACTSYNPHDFIVYKSNDLINWQTFDINCNLFLGENSIWAPEWFVDDEDIYIILSKQHGQDYDIDGKLIRSFRPYIIRCNNLEKLTFDTPQPLLLETSNKIDPHIIKHNNVYNLFIKDEYDKFIEHWTSNDLYNWVKVKDQVEEFGQYVEGTFIIKHNNKFYAYNDSFKGDYGYMYCCESDDLYNWSNRQMVSSDGERLRHGGGISITDNYCKKVISNYKDFNINSDKLMRNRIIELNDYASDGVVEDLELIEKATYRVKNNQHITINGVNNKNKVSEFYFILSTNSIGSLTFNTDNSIIDLPSGYKYSAEYGDNDVLIKFIYSEYFGKFKPTTVSNTFLVNKGNLQKECWKKEVLTTGTYNTLKVEPGVVYSVNGGNDVIINGVSSLTDGASIFFMLNSATNGSITINSGSNISVPGGTFVISKENNNNDCLIEFIKVNASTFRLRK